MALISRSGNALLVIYMVFTVYIGKWCLFLILARVISCSGDHAMALIWEIDNEGGYTARRQSVIIVVRN